jgi:carboxylate-amine ligase
MVNWWRPAGEQTGAPACSPADEQTGEQARPREGGRRAALWFAWGVHIEFHPSARPTLGVEWEFGLVDQDTRDLANVAQEVFELARPRLPDGRRLHHELLRNTVELVTGVCGTVGEAMDDLSRLLEVVLPAAGEVGVDLFGAGTHPFASWSAQQLTPGHRYEELINRTQWWGRQMLIWGVHVHVGMPERDRVLPVLSALLTYFPHLQALSASSPVWAGTDTGYASNRALMFQQLPTAGLPFQFERWAEFEGFVGDQLKTGVIEELSEIRWDLRPAPALGTIENRVCDGVSNLTELAALVALVHCLVVDLDRRAAAGERLPTMPPWHVQENKWRAARYGLDAIVILNAESDERLVTEDLMELLERLTPLSRELGCEAELGLVPDIVSRGAAYQRQRQVARRHSGNLVAVVDAVVRELTAGLPGH